jgi:AraC-like DNA-binding protein
MIRLKNDKIILSTLSEKSPTNDIILFPEKNFLNDKFIRIYYIVSGNGEIFFEDKESIVVYPNTILLLKPGLKFKFSKCDLKGICLCMKENFIFDEIMLADKNDPVIKSKLKNIKNNVKNTEKNHEINHEINHENNNLHIFRELVNGTLHYKAIPKGQSQLFNIYEFLESTMGMKYRFVQFSHLIKVYTTLSLLNVSLRNQYQLSSTSSKIYHFAKSYIEREYSTDFSISDIVLKQPYSVDTVRKIFKRYHKESIFNYRNKLRVKKAKLLLEQRELRVINVAQECGFNDLPNFNRVFKRETGLSPKQYQSKSD